MTQVGREFFGMKSGGGVSVGQEILIEFWPFGNESYVTVEKTDAVRVSRTRLFWRKDLTEEEGAAVFKQIVEAFRVICHVADLQWKPETRKCSWDPAETEAAGRP